MIEEDDHLRRATLRITERRDELKQRWLGKSRWRYVALPFICVSLIPLALLTWITLGHFRGARLWSDLMDWAMYSENSFLDEKHDAGKSRRHRYGERYD